MKVNSKDNIWIEGFDEEYQYRQKLYGNTGIYNSIELLYQGKTSEIPEELAKECTKNKGTTPWFKNYDNTHNLGGIPDGWYELKTAKESIQSACNQEYCLIYKVN